MNQPKRHVKAISICARPGAAVAKREGLDVVQNLAKSVLFNRRGLRLERAIAYITQQIMPKKYILIQIK